MPTLSKSIQSILKAANSNLKIAFPNTTVTAPGQKVSKQDAQSPPALHLKSPSPGKLYVALSLDPDAPFPSFPFLAPILHGIQTNLIPAGNPDAEGYVKLEPSVKDVAGWVVPAPPKISGPHRYVFLLWEQPDGISDQDVRKLLPWKEGAKVGVSKRVRWNLDDFESRADLAETVAGGFFVCGA